MMRCDILHLSFASEGRDIDIYEPVLTFLEMKYGFIIKRASVLNYVYTIMKYRPRAIMCGFSGADLNVHINEMASKMGIPVFTLKSEGDFLEENITEFFWGWAQPGTIRPYLELFWSTRSLNMVKEHIMNAADYNIEVSGATGFDRYKIISYSTKKGFLSKYGLDQYDKVIGIASWGFDTYDYKDIDINEFHRQSCVELRVCLEKIIKNNRDILFVLKLHPATLYYEKTEFYGLETLDNTLLIKNEENIADLISACDIWGGYETTTALEAWLLNKQTFLINPCGWKGRRSVIANGSPKLRNYEEVQGVIDEFYTINNIGVFKILEDERKKIIKDVIEFDDGKNHIRAGKIIYEYLCRYEREKKAKCWLSMGKENLKDFIKAMLYNLPLNKFTFYKKRFPFYRKLDDDYDYFVREQEHAKYERNLIKFYENEGI